ncbi:gamma-glutamyltransferase [Thermoleophilia bacterium SCSIO 60948]|nr:gamma-glutamyltransferase [Thermoleophilia bacterium SCSIO 60948]
MGPEKSSRAAVPTVARIAALFTAIALMALGAGASAASAKPTAIGKGGAASTVDADATRAALRVLRDGGNATDAAIAAAGVLGVTEPFSSGIGGGGFFVIRLPNGDVRTIDGRETAPATMDDRSFFEDGEPLGFDAARYSGLSAGTPGTVATWARALRLWGSRSLERSLAPGARIAREGFRVDRTFAAQTRENREYFDDIPSTARIYLDRDGTPRDVGTKLRNPDMAKAYDRIAELGQRGFYEGPIARAMVAAAQQPPTGKSADHEWRPGLLTLRDLRNYDALSRSPTHVSYKGLDVWGMGPPSSGGSTVGEVLNILDGFPTDPIDEAEAYHRLLEATRLAFADRGAYLADPAYFGVPLAGLLSESFADERRELIGPQANDAEAVEPGDPYDDQGSTTRAPGSVGVDREGKSTTHLVVADRRGMVVSYTFTIESTGGNGIVVPGWGFLLNNELTDFDYDDPEAANKPAGGKRPRSSMAPTIITRDGAPLLAVGSPGGSTIINTVLGIVYERFELGSTLPEAIAAPRTAQQNTPETFAEAAFRRSDLAAELRQVYGHEFAPVEPTPPGEIGAAVGIEFKRDGRFLAAAEPKRRGGGSAGTVTRRPRR